MLFNVLSPFAYTIDADTFAVAAKDFVERQRNLDITRIILADRFKNTMRADIAYKYDNGNIVAGISLAPTVYPTYPYGVGVSPVGVGVSPMGVSSVGVSPVGVSPAGMLHQTADGTQLLPVNNNVAAVGVQGSIASPVGMIAPAVAHGVGYPGAMFTQQGLNKKQKN